METKAVFKNNAGYWNVLGLRGKVLDKETWILDIWLDMDDGSEPNDPNNYILAERLPDPRFYLIEEGVLEDKANGRIDDIDHILISRQTMLLMILEGKLSREVIEQVQKIDDLHAEFNLFVYDRMFTVKVAPYWEINISWATMDGNGEVI